MIPNHILNDLKPGERVAILSRASELHFHVHPSTDSPQAVGVYAAGQGAELLASHLGDRAAIRAFVTSRERDVGGEG